MTENPRIKATMVVASAFLAAMMILGALSAYVESEAEKRIEWERMSTVDFITTTSDGREINVHFSYSSSGPFNHTKDAFNSKFERSVKSTIAQYSFDELSFDGSDIIGAIQAERVVSRVVNDMLESSVREGIIICHVKPTTPADTFNYKPNIIKEN